MLLPKTAVKECVWPAIPGPAAASSLAVLQQLEQSQWWRPEALQAMQFRQLRSLVAQAADNLPFYRQRFAEAGIRPGAELTMAQWQRLPILTRRDLQGNDLRCPKVPKAHGALTRAATSGSTGQPVVITGTGLTNFFWRVFTLREHFWHRRDLSGKLAAIRANLGKEPLPPDGLFNPGWGPSTDRIYRTGPSAVLDIASDVRHQWEWLVKLQPDYLLTYPSNLAALTDWRRRDGRPLAGLREVRTMGETVSPRLRRECKEVWQAKLVDMYTSQEVGYLALQCPDHEHYHVKAENVLVEVLDDDGTPCRPGEIGRVVVTALHNFAAPLLRYEIRDYAEVGPPCPCGRGLPVLTRLVGRERNMLRLPGGARRWPLVGFSRWGEAAAIRQFQFIQTGLDAIAVKLVPEQPLTPDQEARLGEIINESLGYPFRLTFTYCAEIPQGAGGKYEEFISRLE